VMAGWVHGVLKTSDTIEDMLRYVHFEADELVYPATATRWLAARLQPAERAHELCRPSLRPGADAFILSDCE